MRDAKRFLLVLCGFGAVWLVGPSAAQEPSAPVAKEPSAPVAQRPSAPVAQRPSGSAPAGALDAAVEIRGQANEELSAVQGRVEALSDATDTLLTQYQSGLRQLESLRIYNKQLDALIAAQEVERLSLAEQTDRVELVSRDVTPLMLRMIDALESFVSLDIPFLEEERSERVLGLRKLMHRADVSEAEKYRSIMEAYQIENEYGRTIEAYRSTLDKDGKELTVNFLRVGRIALVYQSLDESQAGAWNQETRSWESLDGSYRTSIRQGLRIARKQAAPDLIRLPLPAPQKGES
jgi:hypothetical protein